MPTPPASTRTSLAQRVSGHARSRGPALDEVTVRFRGQFAYLDGHLPDGEVMPLCRLRYGGSASSWGFAIYLASRDGYEDRILPTGHRRHPRGSPRLRLRPPPQRPDRMDRPNTGEIAGTTTSTRTSARGGKTYRHAEERHRIQHVERY